MKLLQTPRTDEEMLREFPRRARAAGWFLRVEETSASHWIATARDRWGHEVSQSGGEADIERMVEHCERYAEQVVTDNPPRPPPDSDDAAP